MKNYIMAEMSEEHNNVCRRRIIKAIESNTLVVDIITGKGADKI